MAIDRPRAALPVADTAQLGGLLLTARRMVDGLYAGRHRSSRRGQSTEFDDFRPYSPGDEPRKVDWKLFGRTDRLYVRRYRHDAQLSVHLIVDRSKSMDFAGLAADDRGPTKLHHARLLAASLAYLAVRQSDRVSLTFVDESAESAAPLGGTQQHLRTLTAQLETVTPRGRTQPADALALGHRQIAQQATSGGHGLVIVISDLLTSPSDWLTGLGRFARDRYDVVALHTLTPAELDLGAIGARQLIDAETGRRVRTAGVNTRAAYRNAINRHINALRRGLASHRIDYQLARTDEAVVDTLVRCLR
jgi:uncharacterized protein (DUF58 family)